VASAIALISYPLMLGLTALAGPFVLTLFRRGVDAGNSTSVDSRAARRSPVDRNHGRQYLYSQGPHRLGDAVDVSAGLLIVLSFVLGLPWEILGVTASYAIMYLLLTYPAFAIPFRLIGLRVRDLGGVLWRPAASSLVMYAWWRAPRCGRRPACPAGLRFRFWCRSERWSTSRVHGDQPRVAARSGLDFEGQRVNAPDSTGGAHQWTLRHFGWT